MRVTVSIFFVLLLAISGFAGTASPIAGTWNCVSTDARGTEVAWSLQVSHTQGKISGFLTITQSGDTLDILEPSLNGNVFTFKLQINPEEIVELTLRIDGAKLEGAFKGKASGTGTIKGARQ